MKSTMIIVSHGVNDAVTQGFVPAAKAMGLHVVLITDHKLNHLKLASDDDHFNPDAILECDVFNPLALIETITSSRNQVRYWSISTIAVLVTSASSCSIISVKELVPHTCRAKS